MESYLSRLPNKCLQIVLNNIRYIEDIEILKNTYPNLNDRINKCLRLLLSKGPLHVNFMDYSKCLNLVYVSNNILFDIRTPEDLYHLKNFKYIHNINFYIEAVLNNEFDTIEYLAAFFKYLHLSTLSKETYKLIFSIQNNTPTKYMNYAYIFDKGSFTMANFNQFKWVTKNNKFISKVDLQDSIMTIIKKNFPNINIYHHLYSNNQETTLLNDKYFDITNNMKDNSLVLYTKISDNTEIYHTPDFVDKIIKNGYFSNFENNMINTPKYITIPLLKLILINYASSNNILTLDGQDKPCIKIWNDDLLKSILPLSYELIKSLDNKNIKNIAPDILEDNVKLKSICNLLMNFMTPIDIIPFNRLTRLSLPMDATYLKDRKNIIDGLYSEGIFDILTL